MLLSGPFPPYPKELVADPVCELVSFFVSGGSLFFCLSLFIPAYPFGVRGLFFFALQLSLPSWALVKLLFDVSVL